MSLLRTLARITLFAEKSAMLCIACWAWKGKACAGTVTHNETPNHNQNNLVASSKIDQRNKVKRILSEKAWQTVLTGPGSAMPHAAHQTHFCWHTLYTNIFLFLMLVLLVLILKASLKCVTQCRRLLCPLIVCMCVFVCACVRTLAAGTALSSIMKTSSLACFLFFWSGWVCAAAVKTFQVELFRCSSFLVSNLEYSVYHLPSSASMLHDKDTPRGGFKIKV